MGKMSNHIKDFEKTYPTLATEFKKIKKEQYDLFSRKMMDYGLGIISLGSTLEEKEDQDLSLTGIWLRCNDKINIWTLFCNYITTIFVSVLAFLGKGSMKGL